MEGSSDICMSMEVLSDICMPVEPSFHIRIWPEGHGCLSPSLIVLESIDFETWHACSLASSQNIKCHFDCSLRLIQARAVLSTKK